jgi:hypothetical protein
MEILPSDNMVLDEEDEYELVQGSLLEGLS